MLTEELQHLDQILNWISTQFVIELQKININRQGECKSFTEIQYWLKRELEPVKATYVAKADSKNTRQLLNAIEILSSDLYRLIGMPDGESLDITIQEAFSYLLITRAHLQYELVEFLYEKVKSGFHSMDKRMEAALIGLMNGASKNLKAGEISFQAGNISNSRIVAFKKRAVDKKVFWVHQLYPNLTLSLDVLMYHIARKNAQSFCCGKEYHAELIDNINSSYVVNIDPCVIDKLIASIRRIKTSEQPRTQFIVFVTGRQGHTTLLDVAFNTTLNRLEIISLDSSKDVSQYFFLQKLIVALEQSNLAFKMLACQAGIQKDKHNCSTYSLAFSSLVANHSFKDLLDTQALTQPSFPNYPINSGVLESLSQVQWIDMIHFGLKAIKMVQSLTGMRTYLVRYYKDNQKSADEQLKRWERQYEMSSKEKRYYIDHRHSSLQNQYNGTPFEGLTLSGALRNSELEADTSVTPSVALRRYAAGEGPMRVLQFLIREVPDALLNERGGLTQRTPLHWALYRHLPHRAQLLLETGKVDVSIPDIEGKTAESIIRNEPMYSALIPYTGNRI